MPLAALRLPVSRILDLAQRKCRGPGETHLPRHTVTSLIATVLNQHRPDFNWGTRYFGKLNRNAAVSMLLVETLPVAVLFSFSSPLENFFPGNKGCLIEFQ